MMRERPFQAFLKENIELSKEVFFSPHPSGIPPQGSESFNSDGHNRVHRAWGFQTLGSVLYLSTTN